MTRPFVSGHPFRIATPPPPLSCKGRAHDCTAQRYELIRVAMPVAGHIGSLSRRGTIPVPVAAVAAAATTAADSDTPGAAIGAISSTLVIFSLED